MLYSFKLNEIRLHSIEMKLFLFTIKFAIISVGTNCPADKASETLIPIELYGKRGAAAGVVGDNTYGGDIPHNFLYFLSE